MQFVPICGQDGLNNVSMKDINALIKRTRAKRKRGCKQLSWT
jgi:hypothetical protein